MFIPPDFINVKAITSDHRSEPSSSLASARLISRAFKNIRIIIRKKDYRHVPFYISTSVASEKRKSKVI